MEVPTRLKNSLEHCSIFVLASCTVLTADHGHDLLEQVLEEARPQLRNESHARGYTALAFEVGPPPPPAAAVTPEETLPRPLAVILESNMECAVPKLTSLRRKSLVLAVHVLCVCVCVCVCVCECVLVYLLIDSNVLPGRE
eukprot:COSAG03_NODE_736_length_6038_cov_155.990908_2_plen_141_part_00